MEYIHEAKIALTFEIRYSAMKYMDTRFIVFPLLSALDG